MYFNSIHIQMYVLYIYIYIFFLLSLFFCCVATLEYPSELRMTRHIYTCINTLKIHIQYTIYSIQLKGIVLLLLFLFHHHCFFVLSSSSSWSQQSQPSFLSYSPQNLRMITIIQSPPHHDQFDVHFLVFVLVLVLPLLPYYYSPFLISSYTFSSSRRVFFYFCCIFLFRWSYALSFHESVSSW